MARVIRKGRPLLAHEGGGDMTPLQEVRTYSTYSHLPTSVHRTEYVNIRTVRKYVLYDGTRCNAPVRILGVLLLLQIGATNFKSWPIVNPECSW